MDPFWQVVIGSAIGGLILNIYWFYKQYVSESEKSNEKQTMATWSIILGLAGIVTLGITSILGAILALVSMRGKKYRALSIIGLSVCILTMHCANWPYLTAQWSWVNTGSVPIVPSPFCCFIPKQRYGIKPANRPRAFSLS